MIDVKNEPPIEKILKELDQLADSLKNKAIRSGLVFAIAPIKKEAKSLIDKDTGATARSIGHKALSKTAKARLSIAGDKVALFVGPFKKVDGKSRSHIAKFLEEGTKRMKAHKFMEPAIKRYEGDLENRFYQGLDKYLAKRAA